MVFRLACLNHVSTFTSNSYRPLHCLFFIYLFLIYGLPQRERICRFSIQIPSVTAQCYKRYLRFTLSSVELFLETRKSQVASFSRGPKKFKFFFFKFDHFRVLTIQSFRSTKNSLSLIKTYKLQEAGSKGLGNIAFL